MRQVYDDDMCLFPDEQFLDSLYINSRGYITVLNSIHNGQCEDNY
jgi:hypothetical protein